ncbi:MAG: hypothetical protein NZ600_01580 [Acidimicrobiales bacterium]|nr:hypothetical protein [Acidimicrobiales bacterium]
MVRRILNVVMTLGVIGVVVIIAARVAEPSVRPILYPASVSPATTVVPAPAEASAVAAPATTTTTTAAPSTTTVAPVATTTTTTTTTVAPVDEVAVLTAPYAWGPSVDAVLLQEVLGVSADGWYGPATRVAHIAENEARGLSVDGVPAPPTTTTTAAPATTTTTTTTTTVAPTTTVASTTTVAPTTTEPASTTTAVPTTTVSPPSTTVGMFGNLGAQLVAQLLGQPCIADGDLSDCGPEVSALIQGLVG